MNDLPTFDSLAEQAGPWAQDEGLYFHLWSDNPTAKRWEALLEAGSTFIHGFGPTPTEALRSALQKASGK